MNELELDRALRAIGADRTRVSVPPSLRRSVHSVPLGSSDGRVLPRIRWRFLEMSSTTTVIAGGIIAAVVGGILLSAGASSPDPSTPGAAEPSSSPAPGIHWSTERVDLSADALSVEANGLVFTTEGTEQWVSSDLGGPDYWTLEVSWGEHEREQRLFLYFGSDGTDWWVDEIRTRDGYEQAEWIYAYGPFFQTPLGEPFEGDVRIDLLGEGRPDDEKALVPGVLTIEGLRLTTDPPAWPQVDGPPTARPTP